jgi:tRNA (guanosine-2'-O-)-methyltransferase
MERTIARLEPLLTPARRRRLRSVLATRSDHVAFVFERMIDPHNLSAALRTLDAFSFQDAHLIAPGERLAIAGGITLGAHRWLSLHAGESTAACLEGLRAAGYRVYASHLGKEATSLTEIDFSRRTALVFGNEHLGVSAELLEATEHRFRIDMLGFSQSLNLSVAVAISAFHARQALERLGAGEGAPERFLLDETRRRAVYAQWLIQSVRNAGRILAEDEELYIEGKIQGGV